MFSDEKFIQVTNGWGGVVIGKKLKALQAQMQQMQQQYQTALNAVNTVDPATKALQDQAMAANSWLQGGDYRQAPKGVFFSMVDPAMQKQQRELQMNAGGQGISALGTPNSTALNLARQNLDDENANDAAANYQSQVSGLADKTAAALGGLGSAETSKKLSILSNLGGMYQNASNQYNQQAFKPGFWSGLLPSVIGAGTSLATKFL